MNDLQAERMAVAAVDNEEKDLKQPKLIARQGQRLGFCVDITHQRITDPDRPLSACALQFETRFELYGSVPHGKP